MDAEQLRRDPARFRTPSGRRAAAECAVTLLPLGCCWILTFLSASRQPVMLLVMTPLTSLLLVRTFLIQHDCGHHAFFERGRMNDWAGRAIGVLTLTPYEYWRRGHALHHAYSGNLDRRGFWDVPMLTGRQFRATFTRRVSSHDQSNISSLHRTLDLFPLHRCKILAAKKPTLAGARIDAHDLAGQRFG